VPIVTTPPDQSHPAAPGPRSALPAAGRRSALLGVSWLAGSAAMTVGALFEMVADVNADVPRVGVMAGLLLAGAVFLAAVGVAVLRGHPVGRAWSRVWRDAARPLVDRVGAMIGFFYFLASITVSRLLGFGVWWVNQQEQSPALAYVGIAASAALLVFLPRLPRATFVACGALAFLLYGSGIMLGLPTVLMALVALFGVTVWTDRRTGLWALAALLGSLGLAVMLLFVRYGLYLPPLAQFLTDRVALFLFNSSGVVVLTWAVADQIRAARERRELQQEAATRAEEAAVHQRAERVARGQVEALADRQRIAREMHDIVAHGLSVMIVQADGARFASATEPEAATAALATIASTGRSSLAEMRRLLSVLRDDTAPLPEAPQPGLDDIASLVQTIAETGRDVRLTVKGDPPDEVAGDALALTAYRTVQESLTNVIKHAGDGATAWVTLTIDPDRVVVEVLDDGPGGEPQHGNGHGLRGMAERVEMVGGQLHAGPDPRGGFRVLATLPRGGGANR